MFTAMTWLLAVFGGKKERARTLARLSQHQGSKKVINGRNSNKNSTCQLFLLLCKENMLDDTKTSTGVSFFTLPIFAYKRHILVYIAA